MFTILQRYIHATRRAGDFINTTTIAIGAMIMQCSVGSLEAPLLTVPSSREHNTSFEWEKKKETEASFKEEERRWKKKREVNVLEEYTLYKRVAQSPSKYMAENVKGKAKHLRAFTRSSTILLLTNFHCARARVLNYWSVESLKRTREPTDPLYVAVSLLATVTYIIPSNVLALEPSINSSKFVAVLWVMRRASI